MIHFDEGQYVYSVRHKGFVAAYAIRSEGFLEANVT